MRGTYKYKEEEGPPPPLFCGEPFPEPLGGESDGDGEVEVVVEDMEGAGRGYRRPVRSNLGHKSAQQAREDK